MTCVSPKDWYGPSPNPYTVARHAKDLVHELGDIKKQMNHALSDAANTKAQLLQMAQGESQIHDSMIGYHHLEQAPLDVYLMKCPPEGVTISPYPQPSIQANAPVLANYADAEGVLDKVQRTRKMFETNLSAILRTKQEGEIYNMISELTRDSSAAERMRIKRMVDDQILAMNSDLEREIMDELLKIEEKKVGNISFQLPERDTNVKAKPGFKATSRTGVKVTAGPGVKVSTQPSRSGVKFKPKVEARINTGLKKGKKEEMNAVTKPKPTVKSKKIYENEAYMTRVYGKALYQNMRSTQKDPYLRYHTSPKAKMPRPAAKVQTQGVAMASAKTQTGHKLKPSSADHYFFSPNSQSPHDVTPQMEPQHGQLIPMAIPLGKPLQQSGAPPPPVYIPSPMGSHHPSPGSEVSGGPMTSTPLVRSPADLKVALITMQEQEAEERMMGKPEKEVRFEGEKKTTLTTQILPAVDIDSEPPSSVSEVDEHGPFANYLTVTDTHHIPQEQEERGKKSEQSEEESMEEEEEEDGIALPGFRPLPSTYHGPAFPPQVPLLKPESSDVIAGDKRRQDLVERKAMEWIEQELMARMLSEIASEREKQEAAKQVSTTPARGHDRDSDSDKSQGWDQLQQENLLGAIGQAGVQLFVDAGVPVDDSLVSSLVKEVLSEKVKGMIGVQVATESQPSTSKVAPSPKPRSPRRQKPISRESTHDEVSTPVPTPEPTPRGSPTPASSRLGKVTPPYTPAMTPDTSEASQVSPPDARLQQQYESADDMDKTPEPIMPAPIVVSTPMDRHSPPIVPRHDVHTPTVTPPTTPPPGVTTPEVSEHESLPPSTVEDKYAEIGVGTVEPPKKEPTPPPSPQPWANPDSVMSEEKPFSDEEERRKPEVLSVAVDEESVSLKERPVTPELERETTPQPSVSPTLTPESTLSDTVNECVSEGQWLISVQSEGEVKALPYEIAMRMRPVNNGDIDSVGDDTLHDTEDLEPDKDALPSEGEVVLRPNVRPERDPMLALLTQMQNNPLRYIEQQLAASQHQRGAERHLATRHVSFGELVPPGVSNGEWQGEPAPSHGVRLVRSRTMEDDMSPGEVDGSTYTSSSPSRQPGHTAARASRAQSGGAQGNYPASGPSRVVFMETKKTEQSLNGTTGENENVVDSTGAPPEARMTAEAQNGATTKAGRQGVKEAKPMRISEMRKTGGLGAGPIMATDDRSRGRKTPTLRPRVVQVSGASNPEEEDDRQGTAGSSMLSDTLAELRDTQDTGMRTTSVTTDRDNQTMTPDQINVEALLQSREYLGQTYTSQSDIGSTTDFGQTGQMTRTWEKSEEFLQSGTLRQTKSGTMDESGHLTQTLEESSEFQQTGLTTRSETELRFSGRYGDSLEGTQEYGTLEQTDLSLGQVGTMEESGFLGQTRTLGESEEMGRSVGGTTSATDERMLGRPGPLTVSVTIPSVEQTDSSEGESIEDVSEIM